MKYAIIDFTQVEKYPGIEYKRGLGASDRAVLELIKYLASLHHEVYFFNKSSIQGNYDGVIWSSVIPKDFECDILVVQRLPMFYDKIKYKKMIMWLHDDISAPVMTNLNNFLSIPDALIVLSKYHKDRLLSWGVPENKIHILPEGVDGSIDRFGLQEDRGYSLVFSSAPFKALPILMKVWGKIKQRVPDAKLHICSGMNLYQAPEHDLYFQKDYDRIKNDPDIIMHDVVTNKQVLEIVGQCALMVYPNIYPETFCAAAIEAIYSNTPVVTSNLGALPETVGNCGFCVNGDPKSEEWQNKFTAIIIDLLNHPHPLMRTLKINCANRYIMRWDEVSDAINDLAEELMNQ